MKNKKELLKHFACKSIFPSFLSTIMILGESRYMQYVYIDNKDKLRAWWQLEL